MLTAKGVKAIIATNVKVDDAEASRIASFFYKLFFEKDYTLKAAFETAEATVVGNNSYVTLVNPGEIDENQPLQSSWTLFVHAKYKEVLDWTLSDFMKPKSADTTPESSNPKTTINQNHSGNGDNVAGNKIERQINMGNNSSYIENQQTPPVSQPTTTRPLSIKESINDFLIRGQLNKALDILEKQLPDVQNTIILLKSRVYQLEQNEIQGTLSGESANMERNRIKNAILSLVNQLS